MIIRIWDWLFTRRIWVIIEKREIVRVRDNNRIGYRYVLRDQFGNMKSFEDWH